MDLIIQNAHHQRSMIQPTFIILRPNEYSQEFHYYPFHYYPIKYEFEIK